MNIIATSLVGIILVVLGIFFMISPQSYQNYYLRQTEKDYKIAFLNFVARGLNRVARGRLGRMQVIFQGLICFFIGVFLLWIVAANM